ncbi:RloB family protein [Kiloniella majae]|uniref:RloB family protein n=1 Tax=Kiloniella majae TaxID=1938558 RepID=UPI000A279923|nr:RloB family protein [Kiloniella majae]
MPRATSSAVRAPVSKKPKRLCVISTEDSKFGAYKYLQELKDHYNEKFVVQISEIIPSSDGKTTPKHVFNRLRKYGYDPSYDTYWVVSDVDRWGQQKLEDVTVECSKLRGFRAAISNNCFEIWLLYHHQGFNRTFNSSAECKDAGEKYLERIGGYESLFEENRINIAIEKAKEMDQPDEGWPKQQGSHLYKLLEYLRSET